LSQTPPEHPPDTQQTSCSRPGAKHRAVGLGFCRGSPGGSACRKCSRPAWPIPPQARFRHEAPRRMPAASVV